MKNFIFALLTFALLPIYSHADTETFYGAKSWRASVLLEAGLPPGNNTRGDCRVVRTTGLIYCWDGDEWVAQGGEGGGGDWGEIEGTLSDQTDLQSALDAKVNDTGDETIAGTKTLSTAPILSSLTATTVPYLNGSKQFASSAVTPTELGYVSGVTSAIQTQLGLKAPLDSPTFTTKTTHSYATATTVPYWNSSKELVSSAVTPTELGYVSGVTSALQTQLNNKAALTSSKLYATGGTKWFEVALEGTANYLTLRGLTDSGDNATQTCFVSGTGNISTATQAHFCMYQTGDTYFWGNSGAAFFRVPGILTGNGGGVGTAYIKGPIVSEPATVDVTADNQTITVNTRSHIRITSDSNTASSRTMVLGDGVYDGQLLCLEHNEDPGTGAVELPSNASNNTDFGTGAATWTPGLGDMKCLHWNLARSLWTGPQ